MITDHTISTSQPGKMPYHRPTQFDPIQPDPTQPDPGQPDGINQRRSHASLRPPSPTWHVPTQPDL